MAVPLRWWTGDAGTFGTVMGQDRAGGSPRRPSARVRHDIAPARHLPSYPRARNVAKLIIGGLRGQSPCKV